MATMLACGSKLDAVCCNDAKFMKEMCLPYHYCQVAVGLQPAGPLPCGGQQIGDPAKCDKDEASLKDDAKIGLAQCTKQLQELYDLERSLVECAHEVAVEKSTLETESQQAQQVAGDAQKCQDSQQTNSGGEDTKIKKEMNVCTAHAAEIEAAWLKVSTEQTACIMAHIPRIEIHIPKIEITIPKVDIQIDGNISSPDFNVNVQAPDFSTPSFDGDIVVPGGGGKLNIAGAKPPTLDERKASVRAAIQTCQDSKTHIAPVKDQLKAARADAEQQKTKACENGSGSLLEGPADTVIQILNMQKSNPIFSQCAQVGGSIDTLIAVLHTC